MAQDYSLENSSQIRIEALDPDLPVPLYHQLFTAIKQKITTGALPTGSMVPSEARIAEELHISRITVKRALNELANAGLVTRSRGRGTVVTANTDLKFQGGANDYVKNVVKLRATTQAHILERRIISAPKDVASNLNVPHGSQIEKIVHTLTLKGKTLSYVKTFVPAGLTGSFTDDDLKGEPLLTLLIKNGVRIKRAEQKITAIGAPDEVLESLNVERGAPLMFIHCIMFDDDGTPVEDISAWYHPEHYQYQMTLTDIS